ncbi:MAG: hypothetical protein OEW80_00005, partial [Gemmatimonadota bacterium]|nr:hypothetical protein [Gemmatimonadota bacterium]
MTRITGPAMIRLVAAHAALLLLVAITGCQPYTPRPNFPPVRGAAREEIFLDVPTATRVLSEILEADSLPVTRVEERDGYIETAWFDATTKAPTSARRLGSDVVRVRAWIDPARRGHSWITLETVYRPLADPALDQRDLEVQVPPDHPDGKRMT